MTATPALRPLRRALLLALPVALLSCNEYPVHSLLETFEVRVTDKLSGDKPVKLDFLWVIDTSSSMCQEQRELAAGFKQFTDTLQSLGAIDARMAVVSVQQTPGRTGLKVVGRFRHEAATVFPINCNERVLMPCNNDAQCTQSLQTPTPNKSNSSLCLKPPPWENPIKGGQWKCDQSMPASKITNQNCSINGECKLLCATDSDCRSVLEPNVPKDKQRSKCRNVAGQVGCQFPPDTETCPPPDKLPAVLDNTQLDLFRCNATIGAESADEAGFEGGFRSAWMALDPKGPNCDYNACVNHLRFCGKDLFNQAKCDKDKKEYCEPLKDEKNCQVKQLLRDDAYLVIVFISDDDDCSLSMEYDPLKYSKDKWRSCQKLGDRKGGNLELSAGNCEFRRGKVADIYCDSDCVPGSQQKDKSGKLKCPNGCKSGSAEQKACQEKADADTAKYAVKWEPVGPVGEWVNRFKGLKDDPSRVIVASVVGNTEAEDPVQQKVDQTAYYHALFKDAGSQIVWICNGARGEAGYGSRYVQLTEAFRDNGVVQNICKGSDFGPALESIATTILKRVIKVCLPQPPFTDDEGRPQIKVTRSRGGQADEAMEYTDGPTPGNDKSFYIAPSPDCRAGKTGIVGELAECKVTRDCNAGLTCIDGFCQVYNGAIFFSEVPDPTDKIEINYPADLGL